MVTNSEGSLVIESELLNIKLRKKELNEEQEYILSQQVAGNECLNPYEKTKEVYETLLNTSTREDGGRIALFGFYYQFLVTIDYLVELAEGKWSFMAFEIHDDIVLCKEDESQSVVRFVQVKTSNNPTQPYTSTNLCNRTKKKITYEEEEGRYPINDSWLDKIFSNARLFKNVPDVIQQFQLITNFAFYVSIPSGSETKNIHHYRENDSFSEIDINDDDPFFKYLKEPVFNHNGEEYIYDNETGMSVRELLSKTQVLERSFRLSSYRDGIRTRLGDMLSKKVRTEAGATITDDDINWLIGEMIASCSERDDKLVLFIDREKAMQLENKLLERATKYSEEFSGVIGNKKHIDQAVERILHEVLNSYPEYSEELEQFIVSVKKQFYHFIEEGGTVLQLVSRFYEGRKESISFHMKMHQTKRDESVYALIMIFLLLSVINEEVNLSSKHRDILAKEVINSLDEYYLTLLKIEDNYLYEDVVKKLNEIITRLHVSSHSDLLLMTANASNKIIIDGMNDRFDSSNFTRSNMEVISLEKPTVPNINKNTESMAKVNYKFLLIPWYVLQLKYTRLRRDDDDFATFKGTLFELWNELNKVGE